jgi:hypothetical protein
VSRLALLALALTACLFAPAARAQDQGPPEHLVELYMKALKGERHFTLDVDVAQPRAPGYEKLATELEAAVRKELADAGLPADPGPSDWRKLPTLVVFVGLAQNEGSPVGGFSSSVEFQQKAELSSHAGVLTATPTFKTARWGIYRDGDTAHIRHGVAEDVGSFIDFWKRANPPGK